MGDPMEAFLLSTGVVAIAEIGDKTQLLALLLAARLRRPVPIIAGIFAATVANHLLAAWLGTLVAGWLSPTTMMWILAVSFLAMAGWVLVPDKEEEPSVARGQFGPFAATVFSFFLLEMGDKTQIATVALGARYQSLAIVTAGTTLGMMIANVPAVLLGEVVAKKAPLRLVRSVAAALFGLIGILTLARAFGWL